MLLFNRSDIGLVDDSWNTELHQVSKSRSCNIDIVLDLYCVIVICSTCCALCVFNKWTNKWRCRHMHVTIIYVLLLSQLVNWRWTSNGRQQNMFLDWTKSSSTDRRTRNGIVGTRQGRQGHLLITRLTTLTQDILLSVNAFYIKDLSYDRFYRW